MNVRTLIGQPVHRAEDFRFLKGAGRFVDDLKREGMLHAVVLRSAVAHGRIRKIDAAAARRHARRACGHDGGGDRRRACRSSRCGSPTCRSSRTICSRSSPSDKVRYVGEPVAVVVAETQGPGRGRARSDRSRYRAAAGAAGPPCGGGGPIRCCSRRRQQPRGALRGDVRRRRRGLRQGGIHPEGDISPATA